MVFVCETAADKSKKEIRRRNKMARSKFKSAQVLLGEQKQVNIDSVPFSCLLKLRKIESYQIG